jgi:hypothetical protein
MPVSEIGQWGRQEPSRHDVQPEAGLHSETVAPAAARNSWEPSRCRNVSELSDSFFVLDFIVSSLILTSLQC